MSKLMSKLVLTGLLGVALLFGAPAFAVDGQILINQSTVTAAGGFPYKITQPGSYKLSGNLVVPASTNGILIEAEGVTLDLNGFSISGPVTCSGLGSTVSCSVDSAIRDAYGILDVNVYDVTIRNGITRGFNVGVGAGSAIVEEIHAIGNSASGITITGGVLRRSIASFNGLDGIEAVAATVTENSANFNGGYGLNAATCAFSANAFLGNGDNSAGAQLRFTFSVSGNNNSCSGTAC